MNQEILSPEEHAVWVECGASPEAIENISRQGGMRNISHSSAKQEHLQDTLYTLLTKRLLIVHNALRDLGWDEILTKDCGGNSYAFSHDAINTGAKKNVVGLAYKVCKFVDLNAITVIKFTDDMRLPATSIALGINSRIVLRNKLEAQGIHNSFGFRDALESVMIALQAKGVDHAVINGLIASAIEAYSNNDQVDEDPAMKFCAQAQV